MESQNIPDYIRQLLQPGAYEHPVNKVELIQTHISFVLVAGDYVYKFKKPVDFGFLNFTTLDQREFYCQQELTLNRRLCPEIYLDKISVGASNGSYSLNGKGEIVEYGIKMVRMPEEKMMGKVLAAGDLKKKHLDDIVNTLVPFYDTAEGHDEIRAFGLSKSVAVNVIENFDQTKSFVDGPALSREQFERIKTYAIKVLEDPKRFTKRIESGRIRDCHGDLYSANICLAEKVYIFDCIEFNDRFRYSDVAGDIGFLAMDLDYHGLDELASYFVDQYVAVSNDRGLLDLIDFYKCYRAYVRGKINLFTAGDPGLEKQAAQACTEQAQKYFKLAERYARQDG